MFGQREVLICSMKLSCDKNKLSYYYHYLYITIVIPLEAVVTLISRYMEDKKARLITNWP